MNLFFKITSLLLLLMSVSIPAQLQKHSFEQLEELQETEKRKMVIFIHTDWCKYCQWMKNTTFKNAQIISILNEKFWFVDLNAEHKNDIVFKGHTFKFNPTGRNTGLHELAEELAKINGKLAFPTICILNENFEIVFQTGEFLDSAQFLKLLNEVLALSIQNANK